jgi:hypothetical protein
MSHGADIDTLADRLKWEASTAMPLSKQREFNAFLERLRPAQRSLPLPATIIPLSRER